MIQFLTESAKVRVQNEGRKTYLEGIYAVANVKNKNNRVYSEKVLSSAIDKIQPSIREFRMFGELGHSESASPDLNRISHVVQSISKRGNEYIGRSRVPTATTT
jgi:hypothetical protein